MKCTEAILNARPRGLPARGFSLIELMTVVAVVSILAMVAIPSYQNYNKKANRSQAAQIMLAIQSREEIYILDARSYTDIPGSSGLNIVQDGWTCANTAAAGCTNNFYKVTIAWTPGTTTYTVRADPITGKYQESDGYLTLTNAGIRYRSAGDNKW